MTTYNGLDFAYDLLSFPDDSSVYSVRLTPESEAGCVDEVGNYVEPAGWPSDDVVSAWVGERVRFHDRGDGGGFEAIYHAR